jgi:hypothetical protein
MRCGDENIIVAAKRLADAVKAAAGRERTLRLNYAPDMPACTHVLTINPRGVVFHQDSQSARRAPAWESTAAISPAPFGSVVTAR